MHRCCEDHATPRRDPPALIYHPAVRASPRNHAAQSTDVSRPDGYAARSDLLGDHRDGTGRALLDADAAALAVVEVDDVLTGRADLEDRVVRAEGVAVVAGEAAAAGQAAPGLEQRGARVQACLLYTSDAADE